jgi:3-hydroxyisobutyrate dehydrogenase
MAHSRVAVLGLGIMGSGMAGNLLRAGFPVTVSNRSPERAKPLADAGARVAASARDAAANADVIVSMVADDRAAHDVWMGGQGALAGVRTGTLLVESSTVSVGWINELARAADAKGATLVDAPVTGSREAAASGQILFLAGGTAEDVERVRPVLSAMGRGVVHAGPTGSGALLKLVNNFMCGVQVAALAETIAFVERSGLDPSTAIDMLLSGAGGSPLVKTLGPRMVARDFDEPHFLLRLMAKDITYAREEAAQRGLTLKTANCVLGLLEQALASGQGERDFSAVIEPIRAS